MTGAPGRATIHRRARVAAAGCSLASRVTSRCGDECEHVTEAERDRLAAARAAQDASGAPGGGSADDPSLAPPGGFWARLRRVFGRA